MKFILVALSLLVMSCASKPANDVKTDVKSDIKKVVSKAAPAIGDVTCSYGDVKRELKVVQSPERCAVEYTKDGATQEIGSGAAGSTFCAEIVERVKNHPHSYRL